MPVRIYDLAKKLGIESKDVLAKAKELGIAAAKVPSSSLDKITAGFLEETLAKIYPPSAPPTPSAPIEPVLAPAPTIAIVTEPSPEAQPAAPPPPETIALPEAPAPVAPISPPPLAPVKRPLSRCR